MTISLPDEVTEEEKLARVICARPERRKYKAYYDYDQNDREYIVKPALFIDNRYHPDLSVNRISTLSLLDAHSLGLDHHTARQTNEENYKGIYHGFAEVLAKLCFENGCQVAKDDLGGTKPYHANIIYPNGRDGKEDDQEIATQLAYHAEFKEYNSNSIT